MDQKDDEHSGGIPEQEDQAAASSENDICELEHLRKLFIGGLAPYTDEASLKGFYEKFGRVIDVVIMRDNNTKRSRGFGFITYTKSTMVDAAQASRPHVVDGKAVESKRALPRPDREARESAGNVKKLFVGGLKDNHDESTLREYFSQFGNVVSVKLLVDKTTGKRRGFAFIEYDDYDSVDKAILQRQHSIKYVLVDVKKSIYSQEQKDRKHSSQSGGSNTSANKSTQGNNASPARYPTNMPPHTAVPPYAGPPPHVGGPPPPPPAYGGYWAPPPGVPPYYQPPPPPQGPMGGWGYPPGPVSWNAATPSAPAWHGWGVPPAGCPPVPPAGGWGGPPPPAVPPVVANPSVPPLPPGPVQPPPNHFGSGYQQNYSGGPSKGHNDHPNRVNPYNGQSTNYRPGAKANSYNGYSAAPSRPTQNGSSSNAYRR